MTARPAEISYRPMVAEDVDHVPIGCQGERKAIQDRIKDLGSVAILAFDGNLHVAQLQFRRYERNLRSPNGLWDPLYWGDFGAQAPELPPDTVALFCYHVGQTEDSEARDSRYQGRGIGLALLDYFIEWATHNEYSAIVAKCTPSDRAVMSFMGGQPVDAYLDRGFDSILSWRDQQLAEVIQEKKLAVASADLNIAARVGCCVKYIR
ncbi:MAG: GNAT superfamily N-acetyltransferase [Gammaproteobacteria bacterium]|jgi:GNAT superfamily N-acetyltransferase